ncbi:hypothetical protein EYF80_041413 [Liparis tanakae]|uniref:Uncharacterized protein n=1 Tax=Liparis tanakae TaxID=230148 RepID=A0A4Z2G5M7_9TELE|nr:hypothetical protein EYF80_041413 [Liparis tanakae]
MSAAANSRPTVKQQSVRHVTERESLFRLEGRGGRLLTVAINVVNVTLKKKIQLGDDTSLRRADRGNRDFDHGTPCARASMREL